MVFKSYSHNLKKGYRVAWEKVENHKKEEQEQEEEEQEPQDEVVPIAAVKLNTKIGISKWSK